MWIKLNRGYIVHQEETIISHEKEKKGEGGERIRKFDATPSNAIYSFKSQLSHLGPIRALGNNTESSNF